MVAGGADRTPAHDVVAEPLLSLFYWIVLLRSHGQLKF